MKTIFYFLFILSATALTSQQEDPIKERVISLNKALLLRDSVSLNTLLHKDLEYGHSNGWEENKKELIGNNQSGSLIYLSIETDSIYGIQEGSIAKIKHIAQVKGLLGEKAFDIKLKVWQIWLKENSNWKLWARQAVKIE